MEHIQYRNLSYIQSIAPRDQRIQNDSQKQSQIAKSRRVLSPASSTNNTNLAIEGEFLRVESSNLSNTVVKSSLSKGSVALQDDEKLTYDDLRDPDRDSAAPHFGRLSVYA